MTDEQSCIEMLRRYFHAMAEWVGELRGSKALDDGLALTMHIYCNSAKSNIDALEQVLRDYKAEIASLQDIHAEIAKLREEVRSALSNGQAFPNNPEQ